MKMNEAFKQLKELLLKNKLTAVAVCLCAVLLFFMIPDSSSNPNGKQSTEVNTIQYLESELEEKLERFLKNMNGVGKVQVCVTYEVLEQTEFAKNEDMQKSDKDQDNSYEYVIIENKEGDENGLAVKITAPKIRGVAVCCEGAESQKIKNEVTLLLSALLNIPTNRVYVTSCKNIE